MVVFLIATRENNNKHYYNGLNVLNGPKSDENSNKSYMYEQQL